MIEQAAEQRLGIGKVGKRGAEHLSLAHHGIELRKIGLLAFEIAAIHRVVAIGHERERQHVQLVAVDGFLGEVAARVGHYLEASVHGRALPSRLPVCGVRRRKTLGFDAAHTAQRPVFSLHVHTSITFRNHIAALPQ